MKRLLFVGACLVPLSLCAGLNEEENAFITAARAVSAATGIPLESVKQQGGTAVFAQYVQWVQDSENPQNVHLSTLLGVPLGTDPVTYLTALIDAIEPGQSNLSLALGSLYHRITGNVFVAPIGQTVNPNAGLVNITYAQAQVLVPPSQSIAQAQTALTTSLGVNTNFIGTINTAISNIGGGTSLSSSSAKLRQTIGSTNAVGALTTLWNQVEGPHASPLSLSQITADLTSVSGLSSTQPLLPFLTTLADTLAPVSSPSRNTLSQAQTTLIATLGASANINGVIQSACQSLNGTSSGLTSALTAVNTLLTTYGPFSPPSYLSGSIGGLLQSACKTLIGANSGFPAAIDSLNDWIGVPPKSNTLDALGSYIMSLSASPPGKVVTLQSVTQSIVQATTFASLSNLENPSVASVWRASALSSLNNSSVKPVQALQALVALFNRSNLSQPSTPLTLTFTAPSTPSTSIFQVLASVTSTGSIDQAAACRALTNTSGDLASAISQVNKRLGTTSGSYALATITSSLEALNGPIGAQTTLQSVTQSIVKSTTFQPLTNLTEGASPLGSVWLGPALSPLNNSSVKPVQALQAFVALFNRLNLSQPGTPLTLTFTAPAAPPTSIFQVLASITSAAAFDQATALDVIGGSNTNLLVALKLLKGVIGTIGDGGFLGTLQRINGALGGGSLSTSQTALTLATGSVSVLTCLQEAQRLLSGSTTSSLSQIMTSLTPYLQPTTSLTLTGNLLAQLSSLFQFATPTQGNSLAALQADLTSLADPTTSDASQALFSLTLQTLGVANSDITLLWPTSGPLGAMPFLLQAIPMLCTMSTESFNQSLASSSMSPGFLKLVQPQTNFANLYEILGALQIINPSLS